MPYIIHMGEKSPLQNNLREWRAKLNLTKEGLAELAGVTRQTIISIEKNEYVPSLALAMKIAAAFKCRVEDIFNLV